MESVASSHHGRQEPTSGPQQCRIEPRRTRPRKSSLPISECYKDSEFQKKMEIDCGGKLEGNDVLYNVYIYNYMQSELTQYDTTSLTTPPKTNMEPKNEGLEDAFSFKGEPSQKVIFQVPNPWILYI